MKKNLLSSLAILAGLFSVQALAAEQSIQSESRGISSVKITGQNNAAYVTLDSAMWGSSVYSLDLSQASPFSREVYSLLVTAVNAGRSITFYVSVDPSPD